jgi:hypothetical protein
VEEAIEEVGVGCMVVGRWTISTAKEWRLGDLGGGSVAEIGLMFAS